LPTDGTQHRHGSEVDAAGGTEDERRSAGDRELEALIRAIVRDELAECAAATETHLAGPTYATGPGASDGNLREPGALNVRDADATARIADGSPAAGSEVMTADEVAAFLGVDRNTVYEYAARSTIPHRRLGTRVLFHRGALVAWLDPCKAASTRKASHACSTWKRWPLALSRSCPQTGRNARAHQRMCPENVNTKVAAQEELRHQIERILHPERFATSKKEVPTFHEWFTGRFWREWVVERRNKPTEVKSKQYIYDRHLKPAFGDLPSARSERARSRSFARRWWRGSWARSGSTTSSRCSASR
jgi:excisionase family DNA binding protein